MLKTLFSVGGRLLHGGPPGGRRHPVHGEEDEGGDAAEAGGSAGGETGEDAQGWYDKMLEIPRYYTTKGSPLHPFLWMPTLERAETDNKGSPLLEKGVLNGCAA